MPVRRGLTSTGTRLALVQAAILIGAFAVAGSLTRVVTRSVMMRDAQTHVTAEVAALSEEYSVGGDERLLTSIRVRSRRRDGFYYRLTDARGLLLAGDLPATQVVLGLSFLDGDGKVVADEPILSQDLVVCTQRLADGGTLMVGLALGAREELRAELLQALFWCGLVATLGGLGVSILTYGGMVRRVDAVADAARAASEGRLDARAPVRKALIRDDLDDLADAFNHMLGQINTLLQNIRQVSADIAHDLRTPLTRARQKLDLLRRTRADDVGVIGHIESINADIDEALKTFDAMLRLAEIESASPSGDELVELAQVAGRVAGAYRPDAEEGGRTLDARLAAGSVVGDEDLLVQALANLLDNALRHTPVGTHIVLETGMRGGSAILSVRDDGPGIPETHHLAVLKRFVRLENSRTTAGSGLGLAIVMAIANRHKARLELLDAAPGLEARITFPPSPPRASTGPADFPTAQTRQPTSCSLET